MVRENDESKMGLFLNQLFY